MARPELSRGSLYPFYGKHNQEEKHNAYKSERSKNNVFFQIMEVVKIWKNWKHYLTKFLLLFMLHYLNSRLFSDLWLTFCAMTYKENRYLAEFQENIIQKKLASF